MPRRILLIETEFFFFGLNSPKGFPSTLTHPSLRVSPLLQERGSRGELLTLLSHLAGAVARFDLYVKGQRLDFTDKDLERFRHAGLGRVLALDNGFVYFRTA